MTQLIEPDAADILEHAITLLEDWGWTRHNDLTHDGRMCQRGAVNAASGLLKHYRNAHKNWLYCLGEPWSAANKAYQYLLTVGGGVSFNDTPGRTKEEVIAKLKEAAEYARTHP